MKRITKTIALSCLAMSLLSISGMNVFAEDEIDFYTSKQIVVIDTDTGEVESTFVDASPIETYVLPGYLFEFDQTIYSTRYTYLRNLNDEYTPEYYQITDDDTMVIELDDDPNQSLYIQICKYNGNPFSEPVTIRSYQTEIRFSGLNQSFANDGSLKVQMRSSSTNINVSGKIYE